MQRKLDSAAQYREDTIDDVPWLTLLLMLCDPRQQAQFDHSAAAGLVHISVAVEHNEASEILRQLACVLPEIMLCGNTRKGRWCTTIQRESKNERATAERNAGKTRGTAW